MATIIPKDLAKNYVLSSCPLSVRNWSVKWLRTLLASCTSSHCCPGRAADTKSRSDDTVRSKSFDIAQGRLAKEAAVFSVELADALVADLVSCACGVHAIHKHPLPCPLQPQLLLVLKRAHRGQCAELMMKC